MYTYRVHAFTPCKSTYDSQSTPSIVSIVLSGNPSILLSAHQTRKSQAKMVQFTTASCLLYTPCTTWSTSKQWLELLPLGQHQKTMVGTNAVWRWQLGKGREGNRRGQYLEGPDQANRLGKNTQRSHARSIWGYNGWGCVGHSVLVRPRVAMAVLCRKRFPVTKVTKVTNKGDKQNPPLQLCL